LSVDDTNQILLYVIYTFIKEYSEVGELLFGISINLKSFSRLMILNHLNRKIISRKFEVKMLVNQIFKLLSVRELKK
jgi:hypothetical protein